MTEDWEGSQEQDTPPDEERIGLALVGGAAAAVAGGAIWAIIVLETGYELGWAAWGIGGLVGLAMSRLTLARGQAVAALAAALAVVGLVTGKGMILTAGLQPGLSAEIRGDSGMMAQAGTFHLRTSKALPADIQQRLDALGDQDTIPDALWTEMKDAGARYVAAADENHRVELASRYAAAVLQGIGMGDMIRSQLGVYNLLWFGLAIATAWKLMRARPEPAAETVDLGADGDPAT